MLMMKIVDKREVFLLSVISDKNIIIQGFGVLLKLRTLLMSLYVSNGLQKAKEKKTIFLLYNHQVYLLDLVNC